jgi:tetratricopeptide (TPR) repeat protein
MKRETQIHIDQTAGKIEEGGKATALEIGHHEGAVTLQVFGSTGDDTRRFHAPPSARRTLVGRERHLNEIVPTLESRRRVLIYGMPGIGKTALAIAAVKQLHDREAFEQGILWVNEIRGGSVESICDAIARRLGDGEVPRLPPRERPDATRDLLEENKDLLVVLDYVDSPETAQMVSEVVVPGDLGLVITSRRQHPVCDVDVKVGPLARASALELFREAARLGNGDGETVGDICKLLGYHPMALWVAASRIRVERMSLVRLRERVQEETTRLKSLRLGEGEDKDRSVWVSLNLSYERLNQPQRRVLSRLAACFGNSVSLSLLASICDMELIECEDQIGQLVANSLVDRSGERLSLQPLVRDFARDMLADDLSEVQDEVVAAVRRYVAEHGERTSDHYDALESEVANLVGAVHFSARRKDWSAVVELGKAVGLPVSGVLAVRGYWSELLALDGLGMQAAEECGDVRLVTRFKHSAATILQSRGDFAESRRLYQENLAVFDDLEDHLAQAVTLHNLGVIAFDEGDYGAARTLLRQSLELKEQRGYERYLASTLHQLAQLAEDQSDLDTAMSLYERSCKLDERFQEAAGLAENWQQMGVVKQVQGDLDEAEKLFERSLAVYQRRGDRARVATAQRFLGRLMCEQGEYEGALDLLTKCLDTARALHARLLVAQTLYDLGVLAQEAGRREEARSHLEESLRKATALGAAKRAAFCQQRLASLAYEEGRQDEADRLCCTAMAVFQELDMPLALSESLRLLGLVAQAGDRFGEAQECLEQSRQLCNAVGYKLGMARSLFALGELAQARGCLAEACNYYGASLELFESLGAPQVVTVRRRLEELAGEDIVCA